MASFLLFFSVLFDKLVKLGTDLGMKGTYWTQENVETFWLTFFAVTMITFVGRFMYLATQFKRPDPKKSSLWASCKTVPVGTPLSIVIHIRNRLGNPISGIKVRLHCSRGENKVSPNISSTDIKGEVEFRVSGASAGDSTYEARADDIYIASPLTIAYK